jgi:hypothetical protein
MSKYIINKIHSELGIQRDGTPYNSKAYINGQWVRFYEGQPRKIGGYQLISLGNQEIPRDLFTIPMQNSVDLYIGRASTVSYINVNFNGESGPEFDRTPSTGFMASEDNSWTFDLFTDDTIEDTPTALIVAHVAPNANDISNTTSGPIFYGLITDNTPLILAGNSLPVSGGIVFSAPILVSYGADGTIAWCNPGDINTWPLENAQVITNTKIVKGYRTRGGGNPTILFWSLNSLIRASYSVGEDNNVAFSVDTIQDDITILSPNSIVQYSQMFFWVGVDQFYFFNGIVQKLKNTMSNDWFFENLNFEARNKVFGVCVPRYSEIWWFYPRTDPNNPLIEVTECNAVIIYNVELDIWYDSFIDRGAGTQASTFPSPIFSDTNLFSTLTETGPIQTYPIWMHETGTDQVVGNNSSAINSYFETHLIDLWSNDGATSNLIRNRRVVPDFVQKGNMSLIINTQMYPNSQIISSDPFPYGPTKEFIDTAVQGGLMSFLFQSNVVGGFYQGGKILSFYEVGDTLK